MTFSEQLQTDIALLNPALTAYLSAETGEGYDIIFEASRYSITAGGKRLRPIILIEFCRLCGGDIQLAIPFACALEMIHTYSLIHDDLPCMDNDDLRRGKPTCHKKYSEAIAVLAGDGLLTKAFEVAAENTMGLPAEAALQCVRLLAQAAGMNGMIAGQVLDLAGERQHLPFERLRLLQELKTGCLLRVACEIGCVVAGRQDETTLTCARDYGAALGLAFQMQDDILDVEGDAATLGKTTGKDAKSGKSTFPALLGMEECRRQISILTEQAIAALAPLGEAAFLSELARRLVGRAM